MADTANVRVLSLFTGVGGLDLAIKLALPRSRLVVAVEIEAYAAEVLARRMEEGRLDPCPIWTDITAFDGRPFRGRIDMVAGGFPCQDLSVAGKRAGIREGKRSGLWSEFARIIGEVGPRLVFVENVRGLAGDGLGVVLSDLADLGFDAEWCCVSAGACGAPHRRERLFVLGYTASGPVGGEQGRGVGAWEEAHASREADHDEPDGPGEALAERDGGGLSLERWSGCGGDGQDASGHEPDGRGEALADRDDALRIELRGRGLPRPAGVEPEGGESPELGHAGEDLGHSPSDGRGEGRPEHELRGGRRAAAEPGEQVGDAGESRREGSPEGRVLHGEPAEGCLPLFPPGPNDIDGWRWVLDRWPELAPARPKTRIGVVAAARRLYRLCGPGRNRRERGLLSRQAFERAFCRASDGLADHLDRVDRLRACGNGVVPVQAALALVELARRAGIEGEP